MKGLVQSLARSIVSLYNLGKNDEAVALYKVLGVVLGVTNKTSGPTIDHMGLILAEKDLIAANRKIAAIKSYRDRTGVGLKEAKEFIEDCGRKLGYYDFQGYWKEGAPRL